jgi:hypothetical protein
MFIIVFLVFSCSQDGENLSPNTRVDFTQPEPENEIPVIDESKLEEDKVVNEKSSQEREAETVVRKPNQYTINNADVIVDYASLKPSNSNSSTILDLSEIEFEVVSPDIFNSQTHNFSIGEGHRLVSFDDGELGVLYSEIPHAPELWIDVREDDPEFFKYINIQEYILNYARLDQDLGLENQVAFPSFGLNPINDSIYAQREIQFINHSVTSLTFHSYDYLGPPPSPINKDIYFQLDRESGLTNSFILEELDDELFEEKYTWNQNQIDGVLHINLYDISLIDPEVFKPTDMTFEGSELVSLMNGHASRIISFTIDNSNYENNNSFTEFGMFNDQWYVFFDRYIQQYDLDWNLIETFLVQSEKFNKTDISKTQWTNVLDSSEQLIWTSVMVMDSKEFSRYITYVSFFDPDNTNINTIFLLNTSYEDKIYLQDNYFYYLIESEVDSSDTGFKIFRISFDLNDLQAIYTQLPDKETEIKDYLIHEDNLFVLSSSNSFYDQYMSIDSLDLQSIFK